MTSGQAGRAPEPEGQLELFGDLPPDYRPDLEKIRARLSWLLAEARSAQDMPWDPSRLSLYLRLAPEMAQALPAEEAAQFGAEFGAEVKRLFGE